MTGRFIVFEGGDATGKSTQARLLAERLGGRFTFEPGDCSIGASVRQILLDPDNHGLDHRAEALLYAADRAQHVSEVVRPTLESGVDVVCDRYIGSSVVYQGVGRGLGREQIAELSVFATDDLQPHVVILLDADLSVSGERLGADLDRLEAAGDEFHQAVRSGFLALAKEHPDTWIVLDGTGTIEEVSARIDGALDEFFS